jgi:hypothetical protein
VVSPSPGHCFGCLDILSFLGFRAHLCLKQPFLKQRFVQFAPLQGFFPVSLLSPVSN